jgi:hypothetical protein
MTIGNGKTESKQLDLGLRILKIAAVRLDVLDKSGADTTPLHVRSVSTVYYMLRIHLVITTFPTPA